MRIDRHVVRTAVRRVSRASEEHLLKRNGRSCRGYHVEVRVQSRVYGRRIFSRIAPRIVVRRIRHGRRTARIPSSDVLTAHHDERPAASVRLHFAVRLERGGSARAVRIDPVHSVSGSSRIRFRRTGGNVSLAIRGMRPVRPSPAGRIVSGYADFRTVRSCESRRASVRAGSGHRRIRPRLTYGVGRPHAEAADVREGRGGRAITGNDAALQSVNERAGRGRGGEIFDQPRNRARKAYRIVSGYGNSARGGRNASDLKKRGRAFFSSRSRRDRKVCRSH